MEYSFDTSEIYEYIHCINDLKGATIIEKVIDIIGHANDQNYLLLIKAYSVNNERKNYCSCK